MAGNNKWVDKSKFITYNESPQAWDDPKSQSILESRLLDRKGLIKLIKKGVPDHRRSFVYAKLLQFETGLHDFEKDFLQSQKRTHGAVIPEKPVPPGFGGRTSYDGALALTPDGIYISDHVLCIIANDFPNIAFAPCLPAICYLLAHFAEDENQLLGLMVSITKTNFGGNSDTSSLYSNNSAYSPKDIRNQCFYFPHSMKDCKIFSRAFGNMLYRKSRKLHSHIKNLHSNLPRPFWDKWFFDFFIDVIPQPALWKLLDGFIANGVNFLLRFALALMLQYQKNILKFSSIGEVEDFFHYKSPVFNDPKCLLDIFNAAEKLSIKIETTKLAEHHPSLSKLSSEDLPTISKQQRGLPKFISSISSGFRGNKVTASGESLSSDKKVDLLSTSTVLKSDFWIALWSWIPPSKSMDSIQLVFTTREHGTHISTLYRLTQNISPMILIIETTKGSIFGAYLSQPWTDAEGKYYGNGETFLFTLAPYAKLYPWVGRHDAEMPDMQNSENVTSYGTNLFVQSGHDFLNIGAGGSGIGLHLDELLSCGETSTCKTFDNEPLTGDKSTTFTIFTVEVFAFV